MNILKLIAAGFAFALIVSLVAAGCGGDSSGSNDSAPAPLTKAEFIKQGDAICKKTDEVQNADIRAYTAKNSKGPATKIGLEGVIEAGLPAIQVEAKELGELGAPSGDEKEIEAIVVGIEEALEKAEENPLSTNGSAAKNPFTEVGKLAREYGFKECAFVF